MRNLTLIILALTLIISTADAGNKVQTALYLHDSIITNPDAIASILNDWITQREDETMIAYGVTSLPVYKAKIIDGWGFECSSSYTGMCAGEAWGKKIKIPIYSRKSFDHEPTDAELVGSAPHTLISSDTLCKKTGIDGWCGIGRWYVGYIPEGDIGFPVFVHEMGHRLKKKPQ